MNASRTPGRHRDHHPRRGRRAVADGPRGQPAGRHARWPTVRCRAHPRSAHRRAGCRATRCLLGSACSRSVPYGNVARADPRRTGVRAPRPGVEPAMADRPRGRPVVRGNELTALVGSDRAGQRGSIAPSGSVAGRVAPGDPAGPRERSAEGTKWLGHPLHPMLTDLPIGFWTSAWVLDIIGPRRYRDAAGCWWASGVLSAIPAAATGAADWSDTTGRTTRVGLVHAAANGSAVALYLGSWLARRRGHTARGVALGHGGRGRRDRGGLPRRPPGAGPRRRSRRQPRPHRARRLGGGARRRRARRDAYACRRGGSCSDGVPSRRPRRRARRDLPPPRRPARRRHHRRRVRGVPVAREPVPHSRRCAGAGARGEPAAAPRSSRRGGTVEVRARLP